MVVPVGPAGTGKTESVKALGHQLGRFVLVFNCDERFDFQVQLIVIIFNCIVQWSVVLGYGPYIRWVVSSGCLGVL